MPKHPKKLTNANQGYWDRIKRARSWIERAEELGPENGDSGNTRDGSRTSDPQQLFILYWIAFNSLYGRVNESAGGGYLRPVDDAEWFVNQICHLDSEGRIRSAMEPEAVRKDAKNLLSSHFLFDRYWRDGYTQSVKTSLEEEVEESLMALEHGSLDSYLTRLLWRRLRVLRNQIFHGASTNRDSLNTHTLGPALRIMKVLLPAFLKIMETRADKETDWPKVPYPRWDSPQHPDPRGPRG